MQDATAQMALLQFMNAGKDKVAVPASVHCDHLIRADVGANIDLPEACKTNKEVYDFLKSVSQKYHIGFWDLVLVLSIRLYLKTTPSLEV